MSSHGRHIRTTNPIESTFATVRLRTTKTRGCVSRGSILSMVFKLAKNAEQHGLKVRGSALIAWVSTGVPFKDGVGVPEEHRPEVAA